MATSITTHVSDYVLGQDELKSGEIARDLHAKTITLVQLVEALGEHLTNTDASRRRRGIQLLVDVVRQLPSSLLNEQEVSHVVAFMVSRLADHHSIQPLALCGLARLTNFTGFGGGQLTRDVVSTVFKEVQNQGMNQVDRRATFTIMINLLTLHLQDLLPLGDTFVYGFIQQMDGEKDPRNLMLAFRCSLIICTHFNLGSMEEEMFEVTACYFPVDFVPKPDDPSGITREDLRSALCAVMSASPVFAKYCYPLLLEKLESEGMSAKLDVLGTLVACLKVYKPKDLKDYFHSFYNLMMKEVRDGLSEELVAACLQALTAMATPLTQLPELLEDFMADKGALMVKQVESDNLALRHWSTRVLVAMAAGHAMMCHAVAARLLPAVCGLCLNLTAQLDRHAPFLTELVALLSYTAAFQSSVTDWTILQPCRHKLLEICDTLVSKNGHPAIQTLGLQGLSALSCWNGVYFAQEIMDTMTKLTHFALSADNDTLREESCKAVKKAVETQKHRADIVITKLKTTLHTNLKKSNVNLALGNACRLLVSVCVDGHTASTVVSLLLSTLQQHTKDHEEAMVPVSDSLREVITSSHLSTDELIIRVMPSLLTYLGWEEGGCGEWPIAKQAEHKAVVANITTGLKTALRAADEMTINQIVQQVMYALIDSSAGDTHQGHLLFMDEECPWQKTRLVQLLLVVLPYIDIMTVVWAVSELSILAMKVEDPVTREQSCRSVATIFNLMPTGPLLDSQVKELTEQLTAHLNPPNHTKAQERALTLLAFLTKALVVRGLGSASDLISKLMELLVHPKLGLMTSECFPLIVRKFPDFLCAEDGALVSPVFQQRFLLQTLPTLTAEFNKRKQDLQGEYLLLAVMGMLPHLPQQVLLDELPKLRKMVMMGLSGLNAGLQMEALRVVTAGLENKSPFTKFDMGSLLLHCLTLATKGNAMMVRLQALKCVGLLGEMPHPDIAGNKSWVLSALKGNLDDPKRLVRKAAVDARMIWYLL